jgi:hypothetical protein
VSNGQGRRINLVIDIEVTQAFLRDLPASLRADAFCVDEVAVPRTVAGGTSEWYVAEELRDLIGGAGKALVSPTEGGLMVSFEGCPTAVVIPAGESQLRVLGCPPAMVFEVDARGVLSLKACAT